MGLCRISGLGSRSTEGKHPNPEISGGPLRREIPLTYNMPYRRELQQQQAVEAEQHKLAELYAQGLIKDEFFTCALQMLDAGTSNVWLDKLLEGAITLRFLLVSLSVRVNKEYLKYT